MYYTVLTIGTKPGMRFQGIEHLKKFAAWAEKEFGISAEVLGNVEGLIYENHVVLQFESLAQYEQVNEKLLAHPEYHQWFGEGKELLEWAGAVQTIYKKY
jgi:hypothetical protein